MADTIPKVDEKWLKYQNTSTQSIPDATLGVENKPAIDPKWLKYAQPSGGSSFEEATKFIFKREGGYANDPDDSGGETNFGISTNANPDIDVKKLTPDTAKQLYKERYWDAIDADNIPEDMRLQVYDTAVNMGVGAAKQLYAESEGDSAKFLELRKKRYYEIVEENPKKKKYLNDWLDRAEKSAGITLPQTVDEEKIPKEIKEYKPDEWVKAEMDKGDIEANLSVDAYQDRLVRDFHKTKENSKKIAGEFNSKYEKEANDLVTTGNAELEQLTKDYTAKAEQMKADFERKKKALLKPEDEKALVDKFNADSQKEYDKYQKDFDSKQAKLNDQVKSVKESRDKEYETLSGSFQNKVQEEKQKGDILTEQDRKSIQEMMKKAPNRYDEKVKFIGDLVDFYLYNYDDQDAKKLEDEIYETINKDLLFDENNNPTAFNLKNQAKLGMRKLSSEYNQLKAQYGEARKIAAEKNKSLLGKGFGYSGAMGGSVYEQAISNDPAVAPLQARLVNMEQAIKNYSDIVNLPEPESKGGKAGTFMEGMKLPENLLNAFAMGTLELKDKISVSQAAEKSKRGIPLTSDEQHLLSSTMLLDQTASQLKPGLTSWYQAGEASGKSLEWITAMAATSGIYSAAKLSTMKALGWQLGKKGLSNALKVAAGEVAGAAARAQLQPGLYKTMLDERVGLGVEKTGKVGAFVPEASFGKSLLKSEYINIAESLSEMSGSYFAPVLKKIGGKVMSKVGMGALSKVPSSIPAKAMRGFMKATGQQGLIPEILEEEVANVLHLVDGTVTFKDLTDWKQHWVTALSVGTMIGSQKTIQTGLELAATRSLSQTFKDREETISSYLSKQQISELDKVMAIQDLSTKSDRLTQFVHKNRIADPETQAAIANYALSKQIDQGEQVAAQPEEAIPQTETGDDKYSKDGLPLTESLAKNIIENSTSVDDLTKLKINDDPELEKARQERLVYAQKAQKIETDYDAALKKAEGNPITERVEKERAFAEYKKAWDELEGIEPEVGKPSAEPELVTAPVVESEQKVSTVKPEPVKKPAQNKTKISETQKVEKQPVAKSIQKKETVKEEKTEKLSEDEEVKASDERNKLGNKYPEYFFPSIEKDEYQTWEEFKKDRRGKKLTEQELIQHWESITGSKPKEAPIEIKSKLKKLQDKVLKAQTVKSELTPEEKETAKELNIKEDEAKRAKSTNPQRTRKSKPIVEAIESETETIVNNGDKERAKELIETIEVAENAILNDTETDESFEKEHGFSEVALAIEYNSLEKNASIENAYKNLSGKDFPWNRWSRDEKGNEGYKKFLIQFLNALSKEGIRLKKPIEVDESIQIDILPQETKPLKTTGIESVQKVAANDEVRPVMNGVFIEEGNYIATDAHKLVVIKKRESDATVFSKLKDAAIKRFSKISGLKEATKLAEAEVDEAKKGGLEGKIINLKIGDVVEGIYPKYKSVIPSNIIKTKDIAISELIALANGAVNIYKNISNAGKALVFRFKGVGDIRLGIDPQVFLPALQALQSNGATHVKLGVTENNRAITIHSQNGDLGLIMPIMIDSEEGKIITSQEFVYNTVISKEDARNEIAKLEKQLKEKSGFYAERYQKAIDEKDESDIKYYKPKAEEESLKKEIEIAKLKELAFGKQPVKLQSEEQPFETVTKQLGLKKGKAAQVLEGNVKEGKIAGTNVIVREGEKPNEMVVESIRTPWLFRRKGKATKAMQKITEAADRNGIDLKLKAVPEKTAKISKEALKAFYEKHGFTFKGDEGVRKAQAVKPQVEAKRLQKSPKEVFEAVAKRLFGTKLAKEIITDKEQMQAKLKEFGVATLGEKTDKVKYMATTKGEVYGFTTPDGKVYIDPEKINMNTPVHEYGHLWIGWVKTQAKELLSKGFKLADDKTNPYFKKIWGNKAYAKERAAYEAGDKEAFLEEVLATAIGDKGEQFINSKQKSDFKQWLTDLFKAIKEALGISQYSAQQLQDITFDEFSEAVAVELLKGEELKPTPAIDRYAQLHYDYLNAEGASKKRSIREQQKELTKADQKLAYLDANIGNIISQLETNGLITKKIGDC